MALISIVEANAINTSGSAGVSIKIPSFELGQHKIYALLSYGPHIILWIVRDESL
jgi:hypothetical protein